MIAELHVAPDPAGSPDDPYTHIEAAIAIIAGSGLRYEVGALGTTFEGPDDDVWDVLRAAHEACLASGADRVITSIRLAGWAHGGPSIDALTEKFPRPGQPGDDR